MRVKDLMQELSKFEPELMVLRPGYEGGYQEIDLASLEHFKKDYYKEWYYGPHEMLSDEEETKNADFKGILIR